MAEAEVPPAKRLARTGSFSGVWWKLGDPAGDPAAVERRLRAITDEEAAVRARIQSRHAGARVVRRGVALASLALEVAAFAQAYWAARRRRVLLAGWSRKLLLLLAAPMLAVPAAAAVVLAAFARLQKMLHARDEGRLRALVAERKAKIGQFRGSHHNMQKLLEVSTKYDPDAAAASSDQPVVAAAAAAAGGRIKRSHSRLSFHIGDD